MSGGPVVQEPEQSISIVVAALGGEGGGVLTDWIAEAARRAGLRVQCTSIPGVAQRTGATTYYIEVVAADVECALALTPMPGWVDLVVASELIEAARAVQNGYVTPETTTLIASTHRVYATSEKSAMGDGRFDATRALKAATSLAKRAILFDMDRAVHDSKSAISAVMFGSVAASGVLPIDRSVFEEVIRRSGKSVDSNLAGFERAYRVVCSGTLPVDAPARSKPAGGRTPRATVDQLVESAKAGFPIESHFFIEQGVRRLVDYQDIDYAKLFVERLVPIVEADARHGGAAAGHKLLCETARHLALRMSFEDLIRVADLKTRASRFARVRAEVGAKPNEPIVIVEYFKPGLEELCGFLPPRLADRILEWAERRGKTQAFSRAVSLRTTSLSGFTLLWVTSKLRVVRRFGHRHAVEQANITGWLQSVRDCAGISYGFGLETAELARLIKGYSGTYRRGLDHFERIVATIVAPAIARGDDATAALRAAAAEALTHAGPEVVEPPSGFKTIAFIRKEAGAAVDRPPTAAAKPVSAVSG